MKRKVEIIFLPEALKFKEKLDLKANIKLQFKEIKRAIAIKNQYFKENKS